MSEEVPKGLVLHRFFDGFSDHLVPVPELMTKSLKEFIWFYYRCDVSKTLKSAESLAVALDADYLPASLEDEYGTPARDMLNRKFANLRDATARQKEFSKNWYLLIIYHNFTQAYIAFRTDEGGWREHSFKLAIQVGALCREYELRFAHKKSADQARLDARRRSEGGKTRAHPDRDRIIEAMRDRIDGGKTIRQAARATFAVDRLGKSEKANVGIWNRRNQ